MLQEARKAIELFHGADELFQVVEATRGVSAFVLLPHLGIAGLIQDHFSQLGMLHGSEHGAPMGELAEHAFQRITWTWLEFFCLNQISGSLGERQAMAAGVIMNLLECCITQATAWCIDDALKGQIISRLYHTTEICEGIADLGAFIETRAANDAIVQTHGDEAIFKFTHLE